MSISIMTQIWKNGPIKQGELLVLLAIADHANDDGYAWPSVGRIAQKARIDKRSARRILRRLEAGGWLKTEWGYGQRGCNVYRVISDPMPPDTVSPGQKDPRTKGAEGEDIETRRGGQFRPKGGTYKSSEPSEPSTTSKESPLGCAPSGATSQKKRATRLSDDWFLPQEWDDWALEHALTRDEIHAEAEKFKDYWIAKSGKDATKVDWFATWRNWIRNSRPRGARNNKGINHGFEGERAGPSKSTEHAQAFVTGARGAP